MDDFKKHLIGGIAGIFGWVVVTIPKVQQRQDTWASLISNTGISLLVGYSTVSILQYFGTALNNNLEVAIAAITGSISPQIIGIFQKTVLALATKAAEKIEDTAGVDEPDEPQKDSPEKGK